MRQATKAVLFRLFGLRRAAQVLRYKRRPPVLRATLHGALLDLQSRADLISVLQIGAYDGENFDPLRSFLREFHCRAVLVEPIAESFSKLQALYDGRVGMTLINAAVTADGLPVRMYRVSPDFAGDRRTLDALTSSGRDVLAGHEDEFPGLASHIETVQVQGISPADLLQQFDSERPDVIVVDTEGFDWAILTFLGLERVRPAVLYFEHKHLKDSDLRKCIETLAELDYELVVNVQDILAIRRQ